MKSKADKGNFRKAGCGYLLGLCCLLVFPAAAAAADYTVNPGDSLYAISMHYHTTVEALRSANCLDGTLIYPGQRLVVPGTGNAVRPAAGVAVLTTRAKAPGALTADGTRTAGDLASAGKHMNAGLKDKPPAAAGSPVPGAHASASLAAGPAATGGGPRAVASATAGPVADGLSGATSYQVQAGDSLYRIGLRFGVDDQAIIRANGLTSALIYPGQMLLIPGAAADGAVAGKAAPGGVTAGGAGPGNTVSGGTASNNTPAPVSRGAAVDARAILAKADSLLGQPYVYGAAGPSSFDCSGFTMFVFNSAGIALPHNAADQAMLGQPVDRPALEPGDLVFFSYYGSKDIEHVGIYAGDGRFIHASSSGGVKYSSLDETYYAANYREARRLLR